MKKVKMKGVIKWFNSKIGYGFVAPDNGGRDVFIHINIIRQSGFETIRRGQHIKFYVDSVKKFVVSGVKEVHA